MENDNDLAKIVMSIAQNDGDYQTAIPELSLYRRSMTTEPMPYIYEFGLAVTIQGGKQVTLGDKVFNYGSGQILLTTADLPVVSYVTRASVDTPYLGLLLLMKAQFIVQLATEMALPPPSKIDIYQAMSIEALDGGINDALIRLLRLLDEPDLLAHVAPLIQKEIAMRLLTGAHGSKLRHFVTHESPSQKIIQAISWLKLNFSNDIRVDDLADNAYMSPSTFRQHFRAVAGMSPVQYQKQLRLQEARQLMLNRNFNAGSAAISVGYESVSQFSREYSRLFGAPPLRDIRQLKQT
ncbi:HTH-type transcriptional activator RhaS [Ephemeroptericola cinctiostellae]|uniref:HTH-type transcriptional activator RhaS n=2 Tax=Ephemeroptericola cinctiostellae TaxID=2268024 RepID=A0A345DB94_9BURK|nr:HTH-type transcriptional activator RhaS [Ephemeroptericola cinctiostellae]